MNSTDAPPGYPFSKSKFFRLLDKSTGPFRFITCGKKGTCYIFLKGTKVPNYDEDDNKISSPGRFTNRNQRNQSFICEELYCPSVRGTTSNIRDVSFNSALAKWQAWLTEYQNQTAKKEQ